MTCSDDIASSKHRRIMRWYEKSHAFIAGLDEAGRGPLAGPVVAAAVVLDLAKPIEGLDDSKRLSPKRREQVLQRIRKDARAMAVGVVSAARIDEINILAASLEAMRMAFFSAENKVGCSWHGALVDGNQRVDLPARVKQFTVVGGDGIWAPIMAASIVAKVYRDRLMVRVAKRYPGYGFEQHKGYATKAHRLALSRLGPTPIHRKSFRPMTEFADA